MRRTALERDGGSVRVMTSAVDQNVSLLRRLLDEVINRGHYDVVDELLTPDYRGHTPASPDPTQGPEGYKAFARRVRGGFPDMRAEIQDVFATQDRAVVRFVVRGTHTGAYEGIPPTGTPFTVTQMAIARIRDGRIAEMWQELDALSLLQQLGVVPPPGTGPLGLLRWTSATIARFARLSRKARRG